MLCFGKTVGVTLIFCLLQHSVITTYMKTMLELKGELSFASPTLLMDDGTAVAGDGHACVV